MNTVEILDRLIAFETVSERPNLEMADFIQSYLAERGFATARLDGPSGDKAAVVGTLGAGTGGIVLSAHMDVVPVEGQAWTRPPFRLTREGDRLYGRGTTDMKGYAAAMLAAADRAARMALAAPLTLVFSYDEEVGVVGVQEVEDRLAPLLPAPRLCIVGEPTEMAVAIGHKGKAAFRAVATGEAGHSSLAPRFVNALHIAGDFMGALRALQAELETTGARDDAYAVPYSTIHIGRLIGGGALNIVPERAEMAFEFRHLPADDAAELEARIRDAADRALSAHPGPASALEVERVAAYPGLAIAEDHDAVALAKAFAGANGTVKVPYGTEAGVFARMGVPTIVCGPGCMEAQGHKADEYVKTGQLALCDNMLDRALLSLA